MRYLKAIRIAIIKTEKNEDVEKKKSLCTIGGTVNWCTHHMENCMEILQKIKNIAAI